MLRNICLSFMFCILSSVAIADATVLGLKMGEASVTDVKNKYSGSETGVNSWSNGIMYQIDTSNIPLEGLKEALAIFNPDGKLVCINMVLNKSRFDEMHKQLRKKYKVVKTQIPFVGYSYAHYKDGKTLIIELDAPHLSFDMTLTYMQKSFKDAYLSGLKKQNEAKKERRSRIAVKPELLRSVCESSPFNGFKDINEYFNS